MVATTIAAVRGDDRTRRLRVALWHVAGLALGAGALALLVFAAGAVLPLPRVPLGLVLSVAAFLWGVSVLAGRPLPVASSAAQVPLAWRYTMTPPQYAFSYGVGLGLGVFTRILSFSFYALVGLLLFVDDPFAALLIGELYALARGAPVVAAALVDRSAEEIVERTEAWSGLAFRMDAATLLVLAAALPLRLM
jgi:cytochrome c biogenesis protein CcdA